MQVEDPYLLGLLAEHDAATLAGADSALLEAGSEGPREWQRRVLEWVAGDRTYDRLIARQLSDAPARAFHLAARARTLGVDLLDTTLRGVAERAAEETKRARAELDLGRSLLEDLPREAAESREIASELAAEMAEADPSLAWPFDVLTLRRWEAIRERIQSFRNDASMLVQTSAEEIEAQHRRVADVARAAAKRIVDGLLSEVADERARAHQVSVRMGDAVLGRRLDLLERWAGGALEAGSHSSPPPAAPVLSRRSTQAMRRPSGAEPRLSHLSEGVFRDASEAADPVLDHEAYARVCDEAERRQLGSRHRYLAAHVVRSPVGVPRTALVARTLHAAGLFYLYHQDSPRLAQNYLLDATNVALAAGAQFDADLARDCLAALLQSRSWARLHDSERALHADLAQWPFSIVALVGWALESGELRDWSALFADLTLDAAQLALAVMLESTSAGTALRTGLAEGILRLGPLSTAPDLTLAKLALLLGGDAIDQSLADALEHLARQLGALDGGRIPPRARPAVSAGLAAVEQQLARGSTTGRDEPFALVHERLPRLVRELMEARVGEIGPRLSLDKDSVGKVFTTIRSRDIRLPLVFSNADDAEPASDMTVSVAVAADDAKLVRLRPPSDCSLGTIDPGSRKEVSIQFDLTPDASVYRAVRFVVTVRAGASGAVVRFTTDTGGAPTERATVEVVLDHTQLPDRRSPYQPGAALKDGEGFVGRERQLKSVIDALVSDVRRIPAVVGIRRVGKTSFVHAMARDATVADRYVPVYLSLEDRPGDDTSVRLLWAIADRIRNDLAVAFGGAAAAIHGALPSRDSFREDPYVAFESFWTAIERLRLPRGCLLVLDEFDKVIDLVERGRGKARDGGPSGPGDVVQREVFGALRKLIMGGRRVRIVVAGLPRIVRHSYEDRLFGTLETVEIRGFRDDEARRVIEAAAPVLRASESAVLEILAATGGQPYLLQVVCHHLFAEMADAGRGVATEEDVLTVLERDVLPTRLYFTDFLDLLDEPKRRIVHAVARLQREAPWRRYVSLEDIRRDVSPEGGMDVASVVDELSGDERPLLERAPNSLVRFRLRIGLVGAQLLRAAGQP